MDKILQKLWLIYVLFYIFADGIKGFIFFLAVRTSAKKVFMVFTRVSVSASLYRRHIPFPGCL